uniref:Transcription factor bHLH135 family n=1 Tax=Rhizophora mucronata TaxID=61149 RepID=A0A2P2JKJ5_RHIMU
MITYTLNYMSKPLIMAACSLLDSAPAKSSDNRSLRPSTSLCKFLI